MHLGFPRGLSQRNRKRYMALWRDINRDALKAYNREYQRERRAKLKAKRRAKKNGAA